MTVDRHSQALILHENGEWLRYVLWGCAIGMCMLVLSAINSPVRDLGKIVGGMMGVLLFSFSGCVLQTRRIVIDPVQRQVTVASRRFGRTTNERIGFDEISRILVLSGFENIENLRGTNIMRERWSIALVLEGRSVPVTGNMYISREQAQRDARKIQQAVNVGISDSVEDSLAHLVQNGRKVAAVTLASRAFGMTTTQARSYVESIDGSTSIDKKQYR